MSKLREAAEAVVERWESPKWAHDSIHTAELIFALREALREDALVCLSETHQQLDEALENIEFNRYHNAIAVEQMEAEEQDEYEFIGTIDGTYGGRWMLAAFAENAAAVWPDGTAVYVRRGKK
jgi:hypothetical protein